MWTKGRQGTGYYKLKLLESRLFKFDMYLLKYPEGAEIPAHTDPSPEGYEHHRLNVVLKQAKKGGFFFDEYYLYTKLWEYRIIKFRPDIQRHGVTRVKKGTRYVLSIGWLKKVY